MRIFSCVALLIATLALWFGIALADAPTFGVALLTLAAFAFAFAFSSILAGFNFFPLAAPITSHAPRHGPSGQSPRGAFVLFAFVSAFVSAAIFLAVRFVALFASPEAPFTFAAFVFGAVFTSIFFAFGLFSCFFRSGFTTASRSEVAAKT
ncbi:hypothetical protein [Frigoriglobus tundricola]|uniref:Uncharacterized protein n=1 Tax=Frigoriglobus tundricola TaxID=2774151 RepID=A0A6M5YUZ6_9BACT|nr:hypothetical protein [Frigoriglobus tundricola]QJW97270.1 hypothetical protein FTUN_4840 [Frigoriglobus tundricola]